MTDSANVIRLDPDIQRHVRARIARLPAVLHAFHELGHKALAELLIEYFDATDDAMFEIADAAHNNQEQNMYFDSMRELRIQRKSMESRFFEIIDEAFARLVGDDNRDALKDSGELSADALSLVQNEDLEQLVALEDTVEKANTLLSNDLYGLNKALSSMMERDVSALKNPFGPSVVCYAIMSQFKRLDVDVKAKLMLFKLFDQMVIGQLPSVFQQLYSVLSLHGINACRPEPIKEEPLRESQRVPQQRATAAVTKGDDLVELLSFIQKLPDSLGDSHSIDIEALLSGVQERKGQTLVLGCLEAETINLVQMLFEFILENDALDRKMKDLLCRMQIPLVKVALLDEAFLTRQRHPARLLINELASVALQCSGSSDGSVAEDDTMYVLMKRTVDRIVFHFENNIDIFKESLADFSVFVEKEARRSAVLEKRTIDAESGKAKAEQARETVFNEVTMRLMNWPLPEVVNNLLKGPWSNVLFVTGLKYGFTSREWDEQVKVMVDLVWSVQPCANKNTRQRLIILIPGLIANLRLGLDSISYNPFELSELFKDLEEIHLARMRGDLLPGEEVGQGEPAEEPMDAAELESSSSTFDSQGEMEAVESLMDEAQLAEPFESHSSETNVSLADDDPHMIAVTEFAQGAWFGFQTEALEGESVEEVESQGLIRCRLAAIIKQADKYIFVNRSGMKVTEKPQEELAMLLKNGLLRPLDNNMLFDKALENVVTGLRKSAASMPGLHDKK